MLQIDNLKEKNSHEDILSVIIYTSEKIIVKKMTYGLMIMTFYEKIKIIVEDQIM